MINAHQDFELITEPELCLLTYRYNPKQVQSFLQTCSLEQEQVINELLDQLTKFIQKRQRENGKSFVSRTRIEVSRYHNRKTLVFRVVLANPLTTKKILKEVLQEQIEIAHESVKFFPELIEMTSATTA